MSQRLKQKRAQIKGCLTTLEKWMQNHAQDVTFCDFEAKLKLVHKYEKRFEEVQELIENEEDVDLQEEETERVDFDARISALEASMSECKMLLDTSQTHDTSQSQNVAVEVVASELPKLELPTFSGEYLEYPSFMDTFMAMVHNVEGRNMTDMRRFGLLKSSLRGAALDSIVNLPMIPENYPVALSMLKERFFKQRLIFTSFIRKLWDIPQARDTASLRTLCDSYASILKGLESIAEPEQIASGIMIQLLVTKFDSKTLEEWERLSASKNSLPTNDEFAQFLKSRCTQLEGMEYAQRSTPKPVLQKSTPQNVQSKFKSRANISTKQINHKNDETKSNNTHQKSPNPCKYCKNPDHVVFQCPAFLKETPKGRFTTARQLNLCIRCLSQPRGHPNCTVTCKMCNLPHNELLHFDASPESGKPMSSNGAHARTISHTYDATKNKGGLKSSGEFSEASEGGRSKSYQPEKVCNNMSQHKGGLESSYDPSCDSYTFLATAIIQAQTVDGNYIPLRVLFDSGSQINLISDRARRLLGLPTTNTKHEIQLSGINNTSITLRKRVFVKMKSVWSSFHDSVMLIVHPKLKQTHPDHDIDISTWKIPEDLPLADCNFNKCSQIDIVLNSHYVDQYTLSRNISLGKNLPRMRETKFGYVIVGNMEENASKSLSHTNSATVVQNVDDISTLLKQFWELETTTPTKFLSHEEEEAEKHFVETTTRLSDGRFVVKLPFKRSPELLGESRRIVERRLMSVIRKIRSQQNYGKDYIEFIDEYVNLGHCTKIEKAVTSEPHYYIPHFSVTNENSTTTRTRVVFDASCKTENDISLNELLLVGPKIQDNLLDQLLKFRMYHFALVADVSKMYRQILVHPEDRKFQYILWKNPFDDTKVVVYELNTVTYGTSSAPFHAIRCMKELAVQDGDEFPRAKKVLLNNFYVDDMLTGSDDENELVEIYKEIKMLLKKAGMSIKKFQSNSYHALTIIPEEDKGTFLTIGSEEVLKTLGMIWDPTYDQFSYFYEPSKTTNLSRRAVLSELSRIFDPLGLVQPVIVRAKLFMQQLYANTLNWDDPISDEDAKNWQNFREDLSKISKIKVHRPMFCAAADKSKVKFELHCFCDASEVALCAALYIRTVYLDSEVHDCRLLTSKTKVAPLKKVELPKLELCSALLLSELYVLAKPSIEVEISNTYFWTDSTITYRWVTQPPHKWKPFIATRVAKIQDVVKDAPWNHVPSQDNPADLGTRGMTVDEIVHNLLWWEGPEFLRNDNVPLPTNPVFAHDDNIPEKAKKVITIIAKKHDDLISRCKIMSFVPLISPVVWPKLKRIFGYVHRFVKNARCKRSPRRTKCLPFDSAEPLTVHEVVVGERLIVKVVQNVHFPSEFRALKNKHTFALKAKFAKLSVFLDEHDMMRVGGRLRNSPDVLDPYEKFPYILPENHVITSLIFIWYHFENLHANSNTLLTVVRQRFWPLRGKTLSNRTVNKCIRCCRAKPVTYQQIMGDLPADRVSHKRPFEVCAVDFAGPFTVRYNFRGSRTTKAYLAIFVCFSTKAVHLEIVEDLTSKAFLNCLSRFVSRRSTPKRIWSDNATNFVGASRQLEEFKKFYFASETQKTLHDWCRDHKSIEWSFTPPRSPHFNGLVEAGVKSAKYHLTRLLHDEALTFPELNTVFVTIEGILNSRPIIPLSCDPVDGQPLTPAHFLIGAPLEQIVEPNEHNWNKRFERTVEIKQAFWRKWSKQYLQTLQERMKWTTATSNPKINDLVVIVDKDLAPLKWKIGKISKVFPGPDEKVRVVEVETTSGTYSRGISELCPIPRDKTQL